MVSPPPSVKTVSVVPRLLHCACHVYELHPSTSVLKQRRGNRLCDAQAVEPHSTAPASQLPDKFGGKEGAGGGLGG